MKRFNILAKFGLVLAGFLCSLTSFSQTLAASGDWNATTVATQTVNLTGNINLKGIITIPNGVTLTINANGAGRNIYNLAATGSSLTNMFAIQNGGTLKILGTSDYRITIGGGAVFSTPSGDYIESIDALTNPERTLNGPAILNESGTLQLEYVTIQNVCNISSVNDYTSSGAVCHRSQSDVPATTTIKHCTIQKCKSRMGVGVFLASSSHGQATIEDTEFKHCIATTDNRGLHGAVVRGWGNCCSHLNLTRVKIHHCFSNCDCGAIYWPSNGMHEDNNYATLTMNGCEFYNNKATQNAGGLDICSNLRLMGAVTKVHHNKCGLYGGGMSIRAYNSNSPAHEAVTVVFDLSNLLEVYHNEAPKGGGIAFQFDDDTTLKEGTTFTVNLNGAKIHDNQATTGNGGGIFMQNDIVKNGYTSYFNMNSGEVYNNTAKVYGGGIYTYKFTIESRVGDDLIVHNNMANGSGGGLYIFDSPYTMNGAEIYQNEAKGDNSDVGRGGGIVVAGSKPVIIKGGNIHNNKAKYGGGLAVDALVSADPNTEKFKFLNGVVENNTASQNGGGINFFNSGTGAVSGTVIFEGGDITTNTANVFGGGVCVNTDAKVNFSNGAIQKNEARSGGGIALVKEGAEMTFSKGTVIQNKANFTTGIETGYQNNKGGLGGGIFLVNGTESKPTKFIISEDELDEVQIYGNLASNGADDIFSNGIHTIFSAPDPEGIPMGGFVSEGWFEDYVTGDIEYANGTHMMGTSVSPANIIRYRDAVRQNILAYDASSCLTGSYTGYACLTLGYKPVDIIVSKKGLKAGESATFDLFDGDNVKRYQIALTGVAGQDMVSKTISYQPANQTMKVKETSWGWSYKPKTGTLTEISKDIRNAANRTFVFENVKDTKLLHSEAIKENVFSYDALGAPTITPRVQVDPMKEGGTFELYLDE